MSEARKIWTRSLLLGHLQEMEKQLRPFTGAGEMPPSLRRRVDSLAGKAADLHQEFKVWPVTKNEKLRKNKLEGKE